MNSRSKNHVKNHVFVCPGCAESITVDDHVRAALIERGCVVCGTTVASNAFRPL